MTIFGFAAAAEGEYIVTLHLACIRRALWLVECSLFAVGPWGMYLIGFDDQNHRIPERRVVCSYWPRAWFGHEAAHARAILP